MKFTYDVGVARASHLERDDVRCLRGRHVTISEEDLHTSADGAIAGPDRRRNWRLEPAAHQMTLP